MELGFAPLLLGRELYIFITHKIIFNCICRPIAWFDRHIIDGTMDSFAWMANKASFAIRGLQSGSIQMYVWVYLLGALLLGVRDNGMHPVLLTNIH